MGRSEREKEEGEGMMEVKEEEIGNGRRRMTK